MRPLFLSSILLLTGATAGQSHVAAAGLPQDPDRPAVRPETGEPAPAASCLLLAVRVDAHGVHVLQVVRKPDLEFVPSKSSERGPFRWTMKNAQGAAIATGGFAAGRVDLDASRFGQAPRVERGRVVQTQVFTVVKVPAHAGFASIEFAHRARGASVPMGSARAASLPVR